MTTYTETSKTAAVQAAGFDNVIALDDVRDRYAPAITAALAKLQTTEDRGRALVNLYEIAELAENIAKIAREARADLKANNPA